MEKIDLTEINGELPEAEVGKRFPVVKDPNFSGMDYMPEIEDGKIFYYSIKIGLDSVRGIDKFVLSEHVGGLNYIFFLSQMETNGKTYSLNFKTREYEYATTNLSGEDREKLFSIVYSFVESASEFVDGGINKIYISPADAAYSSAEVQKCQDAILASFGDKYTKERLELEHSGSAVFDLYRKLFKKEFSEFQEDLDRSRARARSRLFRQVLLRNFPGWKIDDEQFSWGADLVLKRAGD